MNPVLARDSWFARRKPGQFFRKLIALAVLATVLAGGASQAQPNAVEPPPAAAAAPAVPAASLPPTAAAPAPANPALDVSAPAPAEPQRSIFGRWWFWTAVGAAAAATVAVIVISSGGHAPPATDLGNQEFQP